MILRVILPILLNEAKDELPRPFQELVLHLFEHFKDFGRQVYEIERQAHYRRRAHALLRKLKKIPWVGPITASALVASVGDMKNCENGRQLAA